MIVKCVLLQKIMLKLTSLTAGDDIKILGFNNLEEVVKKLNLMMRKLKDKICWYA